MAIVNSMTKKEKVNARAKAWYLLNKERKRQYDIEYNKKNRVKRNMQSLEWTKKNKDKKLEICKKSYRKNRKQSFVNAANRRARLLLAMPKWLTEEHKAQLRIIYKNRPDGYHVDHIVPLKGKIVCGLHVPWNLQYLPATENFSKGSQFE